MRHDEIHIAYQGHSTTSERAAQEIAGGAASLRRKVLDFVQSNGPSSDDEIQEALSINPSTERPRRIELCKLGLLRDSGLCGKTRSGRSCVLWVACNPREEQARLF